MASYRSTFGDLLEPGFREIFNDAFKEMPMVFERIFRTNSSSKQDEKDSGVTGFGMLQETAQGASVDYEDPIQMYDVTYTHKKYTKGFKVSEELVEDDQYNVIKGKPAQLARAARRTAEYHGAEVLNKAFTTSGYNGGDAKPLCSVGHPRSDGGTAQSNASSTGITLTEENLETARIAFRQQLDDKGMRIQAMPGRLIVPVDLEKDAKIIVGSTLRPGTADNDMNIYKGALDVIAWEYITVNNTCWFLQDMAQHQLNWFWRVRPEFKQDVAFDTGMALFKSRTRFSKGWSDWRGFWGSAGDGSAYAG
jgi:phage major head subunit gpT-like protein